MYILGLMNSVVFIKLAKIFAQGLSIGSGHIANVPFKYEQNPNIDDIVKQNISISRTDWDAHETSWDFQENELVRLGKEQGEGSHRLSDLMEAYRDHWTEQFLQLHANEEELNRQFIEIYGLEDELTPDVPPEEITILQQGELSFN